MSSRGIAGAPNRVVSAITGALALGMPVAVSLFLIDRALHPSSPDAGQLGALGAVIGLPLGFVVGWLIAPHKQMRRLFLASSVGAFVGAFIQSALIEVILFIGRQTQVPPSDPDSLPSRAVALVGLLSMLAGCAGGWFFARRWTSRLEDREQNP